MSNQAEPDTLALHALLEGHEGRRAFPYRDSVGKLTIGVGRNLSDRGLSEGEIDQLLAPTSPSRPRPAARFSARASPEWRSPAAMR